MNNRKEDMEKAFFAVFGVLAVFTVVTTGCASMPVVEGSAIEFSIEGWPDGAMVVVYDQTGKMVAQTTMNTRIRARGTPPFRVEVTKKDYLPRTFTADQFNDPLIVKLRPTPESIAAAEAKEAEAEARQAEAEAKKRQAEAKARQIAQEYANPAYRVTQDQLTQEYRQNEYRMTEKYTGKVIAISGRLKEIRNDIQVEAWYGSSYYIILEDSLSSIGTYCYFTSISIDEIYKLNRGQRITVVGRYRLFNFILTNHVLEGSRISW
jgi:hypothetical protein